MNTDDHVIDLFCVSNMQFGWFMSHESRKTFDRWSNEYHIPSEACTK